MIRIGFGILLAAILVTAAQAQDAKQELLKHGDVIIGQVKVVNAKHPDGTTGPVYQIVADAPKPFAHKDACKLAAPKTFHLIETDNKAKTIRLKRSVGQKAEVIADDFTCAKDVWHVGDAVATKWRFTGPLPR